MSWTGRTRDSEREGGQDAITLPRLGDATSLIIIILQIRSNPIPRGNFPSTLDATRPPTKPSFEHLNPVAAISAQPEQLPTLPCTGLCCHRLNSLKVHHNEHRCGLLALSISYVYEDSSRRWLLRDTIGGISEISHISPVNINTAGGTLCVDEHYGSGLPANHTSRILKGISSFP